MMSYRSSVEAGELRELHCKDEPVEETPREREAPIVAAPRPMSSLGVGAKAIAGIGIGLLAVVGGSAVLGVVAETVLIPSLLLKLAGGVAGGGLGLAKGIKDTEGSH